MSQRSCYYQYHFQGSAFVYSVWIQFANDPSVHFQISLWIPVLCFSLVCHTRRTNHTTSYKEPHMHGTGYIAYVSSQVPSSKVPAEYFIRRTGNGHSANPEMTSMWSPSSCLLEISAGERTPWIRPGQIGRPHDCIHGSCARKDNQSWRRSWRRAVIHWRDARRKYQGRYVSGHRWTGRMRSRTTATR